MTETKPFDFNATYKANGWGEGIAWRATAHVEERDEDYEWSGIAFVDTTRVTAHMVGDDAVFTFDIEDLILIPEEEYCAECGQVGCTASPLGSDV